VFDEGKWRWGCTDERCCRLSGSSRASLVEPSALRRV